MDTPDSAPHPHPAKIRVAAVDDHPLVLDGLDASLRRTAPHVELVATGSTTDEVLESGIDGIDVVLLDLTMQRPEGQDLESDIERWVAHGAAVVLHTAGGQPVPLRRAISAGASGLILKVDSIEQIIDVIETVHSGETAYSGELAHALVTDPRLVTSFSPREVEVLELIASGSTHRMVARELGIGDRAVKEYLDRAMARVRARGIEPGNAHGVVSTARREGHLD